jgi:hypothetical protein
MEIAVRMTAIDRDDTIDGCPRGRYERHHREVLRPRQDRGRELEAVLWRTVGSVTNRALPEQVRILADEIVRASGHASTARDETEKAVARLRSNTKRKPVG